MPGDFLSADKLLVFCLFFIPGFIASQLYSLFIGVDDTDLAKRLPAVIGYSALHYALTGWVILVSPAGIPRSIATYIVVLVLPIFWAPLILLVRDFKRWRGVFLKKRTLNLLGLKFALELPSFGRAIAAMQAPEAFPWDRKLIGDQYVRIRLKSGRYVGGYFSDGSIVSTYPSERQIFIAQAFTFDENGVFGTALPDTGVMVQGEEIETLETIEIAAIEEEEAL